VGFGRTDTITFVMSIPHRRPVWDRPRFPRPTRAAGSGAQTAWGEEVSSRRRKAAPAATAGTGLVKARIDVIITSGEQTVLALQQATKTIPIVALVSDMLGSGLVTSLARPEGNITGVSILVPELDGKRQDILIEAVPGLRLMAVLADVNYTRFARLDALQEAARARNVELSIHRVAKGEEIAAAIGSAEASGAKALNILASPLFYLNRHLIMERAAAAQLPTIYEFPEIAEDGGYEPRPGPYATIQPRPPHPWRF
jgi:putative ABC transport system substrate-binding protein